MKGRWSRGRGTHLEVLSNLTNKTLEGELADEQLGRLLVATNFTESDGTGPEAVRLLDTTSRAGLEDVVSSSSSSHQESTAYRGSLASGRLGSELLTRGLATGGLAGSLLSAGHL